MREATIHLGFEVGTGEPVSLPLRNMAVTGQTQEAGKTTAMEGLITRSGLRAVTFITKRGERSFAHARRIPPYFRERTDWQFIEAVLESTMRQKMRFERAWIVKACRSAKTLADVRTNVRTLQASSKRSMDQDLYMLLGEYLDLVVPLIEQLGHTPTLELGPGVNAIDLSNYVHAPQLQALVIRSVLEWVYQRENGVVVVIPEAWEFIPQGRGSPVKLAAIELVRKGSGLRNYVWLDSQDLGGVEKELTRQCPVTLYGVQREANEIKRTLANAHGAKKPKPSDVASLGLGEFIACWPKDNLRRVFVQPAWLDEATAVKIATGKLDVRAIAPPSWKPPPRPPVTDENEMIARAKEAHTKGTTTMAESNMTLDDLGAHLVSLTKAVDRINARSAPTTTSNGQVDEEALFDRLKARLLADPDVVAIADTRPVLQIATMTPTIEVDGDSLKGRIGLLIARGWYNAGGRTNSTTRAELARTGPDANTANISRALAEYVRLGFLTNESDGYKAVAASRDRLVTKKGKA